MQILIAIVVSVAMMAYIAPDVPQELLRRKDCKHQISWHPVLLGTVGVLVSLFLNNFAAAVLSVVLAFLYNRKFQSFELENKKTVLDAQSEVALQLIASLYETSGDLIGSMERAAECVDDPLCSELQQTVSDYRNGMSVNEAMRGLVSRVPSRDLQIFVDGVLEAEKYGADPGEVVSAVVRMINDRMNLREDLKNELKGQRLTVNTLLILLPLMVGLSLVLFPQSKAILTQTFTGKMIICGVFFAEYIVWALSTRGVIDT